MFYCWVKLKILEIRKTYGREFDTTHLHRVRHAVVITAVVDLGEKVLAELENKELIVILVVKAASVEPVLVCDWKKIEYESYDPIISSSIKVASLWAVFIIRLLQYGISH